MMPFSIKRPSCLWLILAIALGLAHTSADANVVKKYPKPERYRTAMQNSSKYLKSPRAKLATIRKDKNGIPLAYSGNFSSVYEATDADGILTFALRLFHPNRGMPGKSGAVDERQNTVAFTTRYQAIQKYLDALRADNNLPPEIIKFSIEPKGIRIDGATYPTMEMEWVQGVDLGTRVGEWVAEGNLQALRDVAENFRFTMSDLTTLKIAHGDLHGGNSLVNEAGETKLVDYDTMYVPELAGLTSSEIGQPNYQHPQFHFPAPATRPFNEKMDRFSALVIYTSLRAVAADPSLWDRFHNDDNLIIDGQRDLTDPDNSEVFTALAESKDPVVRKLAVKLADYAYGEADDVPPLETVVKQATGKAKPTP